MRVSIKKMTKTVTILNKLKKEDSSTNTDVWVKHILHDCFWSSQSTSSQEGNTTNLGAVKQVQIPAEQETTYLPYKEWKKAGNQTDHFTVYQGDYVILGEVEEDVTPATITKIISSYGMDACKVRNFRDLNYDGVSASGVGKYAKVYVIEGV